MTSTWSFTALGLVGLLLLLGPAPSGAASHCTTGPPDAFSENIDPLLTSVEGAGFPGADNLASWHGRRGEIQSAFGEIIILAGDDVGRRTATVEALLAAESLAFEPDEARRLVERTRGETRAWARRRLSTYYAIGVTPEDLKLVDADFISALKNGWGDVETEHPQRNLPLYESSAAALRGLAKQACE